MSFRRGHARFGALAAALALLLCAAALALLMPEAPGDTVYQKSGTTVDASHADQGYIMVMHKATEKKLKCRVSLGKNSLTYDLNSNGEYEPFPLQLGSGKYKVQVFSQVSGNKYSTVSSISFKAKVADETYPYLYPNQFVSYQPSTLAVLKADELCRNLSTDREKFQAVYQYVVDHTVYDYVRAAAVISGQIISYLPDMDDVYTGNKGICFDFASLVACMLRSQDIPAKLVIGYADQAYHAWNEVWLDGEWLRCDATSDVCGIAVKSYTTERVY